MQTRDIPDFEDINDLENFIKENNLPEELYSKLRELDEYKKQKEHIRKIIGSIGGAPTTKEKVMNMVFLVLVLTTFELGIFHEGIFRTLALEIGILLISLKMAYFLHNEAKVNHFQFWILSSLEWQTNNLERRLRDVNKKLDKIIKKIEDD